MISILRITLFLLSLTLEVRVHAKDTSHPKHDVKQSWPTQQPTNCLHAKGLCAIRTSGQPFEWKLSENQKVILDQETTVIRSEGGTLTLVEGTVWYKGSGDVRFHNEYADFSGMGEFWLERLGAKTYGVVVQGELQILARGSLQSLTVLPGHQNWVGPAGVNGQTTTGVPMSADFNQQVRRWKKLFRGDDKSWKKQVKDFYKIWKSNVALASVVQKNLAERHIAEDKREKELQWAEAKKRQAEEEELRTLFRRKTFGEAPSL